MCTPGTCYLDRGAYIGEPPTHAAFSLEIATNLAPVVLQLGWLDVYILSAQSAAWPSILPGGWLISILCTHCRVIIAAAGLG
jgi:hypothetical protein